MKVGVDRIAKNPLVIVAPLVVLGLFGWNAYVKALNKPNHAEHNLLHNGSFEAYDEQGSPRGWTIDANKTIKYSLNRDKGYGGGRALGVHLDTYTKGSFDLKSTIVALESNAPYFYKGYYHSDVPFSLLVRHFYKDGTTSLRLVRKYASSDGWATASTAFQADDRTDRVQIVYRLAGKGSLYLDRAYLEERAEGASIPEELGATFPNLLENGALSEQDDGDPVGWTSFDRGNNTAESSYVLQDGAAYLRTVMTGYKSGEAKWDHEPIPTEHGKYTQFFVDYRSDVPVRIVAEYVLDDRKRTFATLEELPPADAWTKVRAYTEAPPRAVEVTIHVVLAANGTLDTDNYIFHDLTKQDVRHFNRPLVSLTFDGGWDSSYITAARILEYLHYKGTFYINPDAVGQPDFLSHEQLDKLLKEGHQLASQGYEHVELTTLNARQLDRQLRLGKEYFVREYQMPGVDFAPPNGRYDAEVQEYARSYYRSVRTTDEGVNTKQNIDPNNLKTLYVDRDTTPQRFQAALDEAKQQAGWLIVVYPRVKDNHPHRTTVTPRAFAEQLELISKSGITVKTVEAALDEVWAQ